MLIRRRGPQLRTNLLAPLTDSATIDTRLDVVAELVQNEDRFRNLRRALKSLERIDADKITGSIQSYTSVTTSAKAEHRKQMDASKESERKIALVLQLRTFIKGLPMVRQALMEDGGVQSSMLNTIVNILGDERLKSIEEEISDTLNEQALSVSTLLFVSFSFFSPHC